MFGQRGKFPFDQQRSSSMGHGEEALLTTNITVSTDHTNYSRYSTFDGRNIVTATITFTPNVTVSDTFTIKLQRQPIWQGGAQYGLNTGLLNIPTVPAPVVIATQTVVLNGNYPNGITVTFDLHASADTDGFMNAHFSYIENDYSIVVTNSTNVSSSAQFTVLVVTVEEMRNRWLYGLPLIAREQLQVVTQPGISGVTLTTVGFGTARGAFPVTFTSGTPNTLSFNGGTAVAIPTSGTYSLYDTTNNWVSASVNTLNLPGTTTTGTTLLEYNVMSDQDIIRQVIQSTFDCQRGIKISLEPTHVVCRNILQYLHQIGTITDSNGNLASVPATWDEIDDGVPFYRSSDLNRWPLIETNRVGILKVIQLHGYFNKQLTISIPQSWISHNIQNQIYLIPTAFAVLSWVLSQAAVHLWTATNASIPEFWAYEGIFGIRQGVPSDVQQYIAIKAAIPLLLQAAQARYGPISAYSLSRDGVAESQTLIPGIYLAYIDGYNAQIGAVPGKTDAMMKRLRQTYAGLFVKIL